jgi:hypothetical protein
MLNKKTGQKINGGARPGAGRKPDWLKEKCKGLIDKHKLLDLLAKVASGDETEPRLTKDGEVVDCPVGWHDRLHAIEMLLERGFGKPQQGVDVTSNGQTILKLLASEANEGR